MNPLVSILIPAYNMQEWIAEAIESALRQTWRRSEVVIVDDGSRDQTLHVSRRFASKAVCVISQTNQGASAARNAALAACQGDYIQWLDADDRLEPDKIEQQVRRIGDGGSCRTLLSGAWASFYYRTRTARFSPTPLWSDLAPVEWLFRKLGQNLYMQTANWLVSRELTEAAGPWDTRLLSDDDGEYFCRVLLASDGVRFIPEAKSYYRRTTYFSSVSYIAGSNKKLEALFISMMRQMNSLLSMEDSERTRSACIQYIRNWLHEFYPYRRDLGVRLIQIASELGGRHVKPRLQWRYHWIVKLFGWSLARRAQTLGARARLSAASRWDGALYHLEEQAGLPFLRPVVLPRVGSEQVPAREAGADKPNA